MQVTSTGIAVALAVVVALGLLFFGPKVFAPFGVQPAQTATSTLSIASSTETMDTTNSATPAPVSGPLPTELTVTDTLVGTGAEATTGSTVTVKYAGTLPDGTPFDSSAAHGGEGITFQLGAGRVIKGWDQGIVGMKVGGKRHLIIPPSLGYGNQAVGPVIPANATLVFDVELVNVQ